MKKFAWRKPIYSVCRVRTAVALLLVVFYIVSPCLPAQAHPSKAKAETFAPYTGGFTAQAQTPPEKELDGMVADNRVRALARHIHADQIASIQFTDLLHGPNVPSMPTSGVDLYPYFAPTVADRRLIARFLRALRHAYKQKGVMPAMDTPSLEITFRKSGHFQREPLDIDINFDYFGSEFQSVLNQVPDYLAAQLHRRMQTLDGQVREVDFATLKVTNPQKIAQIIRALKQVKPNAFSMYGNTTDTFGLSLRLRQGGSEEVVLVIAPSISSHKGFAVLPEPLWEYYKVVFRGKAVMRLNTDAHKTFQPAFVLGTTPA